MKENQFLRWLSGQTKSLWWHDSADPDELRDSLELGAVGATTNPLLIKLSLFARPDIWAPVIRDIPGGLPGEENAERILETITRYLAGLLEPTYRKTAGRQGYVCTQVNPCKPGNAEAMLDMAKRLNGWAPNVAVKLPATLAGLQAGEECVAQGITVTITASFTVPQALAIGEMYRKGAARAKKAGITPAPCFAVLMIGRLDDYLRDVAADCRSGIAESDLIQAGVAVAKRAYELYGKLGYEPQIMPAGMRGSYHMTELAGADMVFSTAPKIQGMVSKIEAPFEERIDRPVDPEVIARLSRLPEFVRAYEPEGMKPEAFITYGVTQKTLSQFVEAGWLPLESYKLG